MPDRWACSLYARRPRESDPFSGDKVHRVEHDLPAVIDREAFVRDGWAGEVAAEEDYRCCIAHQWSEKKNLDAVLADSEQLLRQTYGYTSMRNDPKQRRKADALLDATHTYARKIAAMPEGTAELADSTSFSPEGVQSGDGRNSQPGE